MKSLPLYLGYEHDCDYLPGRRAQMVYVDPHAVLDKSMYSRLATNGFRRSGGLVYRPHCAMCAACVPVRVPVAAFQANRSQRRTLKLNADLCVVAKPPVFDERHYQLYLRYLQARHPDGNMAESSREDYLGFLGNAWGETVFYEFLAGDTLLAVAVVDHLDEGWSAVYTFYDPDQTRRGLGSFAVLWQIDEARRRGLPWLYLGFWIQECRKMTYKSNFRPFEALLGNQWVAMGEEEAELESEL
jgi:arginine-tRNA-protein transferase